MADLDNLKDKYEGKKEKNLADTIKDMKDLTAQLGGKKQSAPVRAAKQAISGFRSQWSGIDEKGNVGVGKGVPGIYYDTVAIPALAGIVDDKYAPEFAVEADKKAGKIREGVRKDMGIEAPRGALEHFANAGGTMLGQLPVPGAWLSRVLNPVKSTGIAGKVATSPIEYLSPIVDPKKINYGVGTGFGGTIGVVGEALEEEPIKKALGGLIQKYEDGGKVGKVKSFFSAVDKAIDTLKQKKGTGEQILKEIEKAPGVKKEELELRKISEKLKDKKSITQDEVRALAAESPAPNIKPIVLGGGAPLPEGWQPELNSFQKSILKDFGVDPVIDPDTNLNLGFMIEETGEIVDFETLKQLDLEEFGLDPGATVSGPKSAAQALDTLRTVAGDVVYQFKRAIKDPVAPKFEKYTTPGGENYREILLQLDQEENFVLKPKAATIINYELTRKGYSPLDEDQLEALNEGGTRAVNLLQDMKLRLGVDIDQNKIFENSNVVYRSGHFDEPNILTHARVTDRTGPNGEKILYVEEIQSDWHQAGRSKGYKSGRDVEKEYEDLMLDMKRQVMAEKYDMYKKIYEDPEDGAKLRELLGGGPIEDMADRSAKTYIMNLKFEDLAKEAGKYDEWKQLYDDLSVERHGVPDAPFKKTSHELALKQILDMAANEGYDRVAIAPGSEQIKRYHMSNELDSLRALRDDQGRITLAGIKNNNVVIEKLGIDPEDLPGYIGKEKSDQILAGLGEDNIFELKGDDLKMTSKEGQGKKKIYDEILPNYLSKYAKKEFGAEPGQVEIEFNNPNMVIKEERIRSIMDDIADEDNDDFMLRTMEVNRKMSEDALAESGIVRADLDEEQFEDQIWNVMDEFAQEAREQVAREMAIERIKGAESGKISAFSVPVTPQMREKITGEGQKLFAAAPVVGVQGIPGMEEAPQQAAPEPEPEVEEMSMPFQSGGMATPRSELEEDPFVQTVLNAARHYQGGKEIEAGQVGLAKGPVTVGINAANIIDPGTRDAMQAQALFAAYRDRLGGVDVNASVNKPAQGPDGFYQGNVMASVPVGPGRAMAGVSGYKSPQKTDVSGYNVGYGQKVGPGYASGSVFQPKDRRQDTRYDVQYTIPFQSGGAVGLQDGGRVGKTRAAAEKLLRVLHGSPTRITPESGKAIDVTTEPSYAVKRGADKMIGKSGPPMVNQFDIPQGRMLQFEEQYSPEDVALMRRYFNKLPQGQAMRGEEIFDAAQGRDAILEGIAKAGGFAGYERPNTGAVGKGQWFRVTEPEELMRKSGGGKVDTTRRALLGLLGKPQQAQSQPLAVVNPSPAQETVSPLQVVAEKVMQTPMTRRDFMKNTGEAVGAQAVQNVTGGLGLGSIAKMAAKSAVIPKSTMPEQEIADSIAEYASSIIEDESKLPAAFAAIFGKNKKYPSGENPYNMLSDIGWEADQKALESASKSIGFDIPGIVKATGIPEEEIRRVIKNDSELFQKVTDAARKRASLEQVLEDGRSKEAYRSTSISDIDEQELEGIIDQVIKEFGKDADEADILGEVNDRFKSRFYQKERLEENADPMYRSLYKNVMEDDILDNVFEQFDFDDTYQIVLDKFYGN